MTHQLAAVLVGATLAGCAQTSFTPHGDADAHVTPLVTRAVVVDGQKVEVLAAAGGVRLGTLEVKGDAVSSITQLSERARVDGAARGATHILPGHTSFRELRLADDSTTTDCRAHPGGSMNCTNTNTPGGSGQASRREYILIRVPPERWGELPPDMRSALTRATPPR